MYICTVEPPSKGHFGTSHFVPCMEVVLFSEFEMYCTYTLWDVVPFSEGPLLEVPLYMHVCVTCIIDDLTILDDGLSIDK